MDKSRPTKKQKELLSFIDSFIKGNGYGPSYREIMRALDYKSVSTVATHVNGLIARGWLIKKDNSARSLEVVTGDKPQQVQPASSAKLSDEAFLSWLKQRIEAESDPKNRAVLQAAYNLLDQTPPSPL